MPEVAWQYLKAPLRDEVEKDDIDREKGEEEKEKTVEDGCG